MGGVFPCEFLQATRDTRRAPRFSTQSDENKLFVVVGNWGDGSDAGDFTQQNETKIRICTFPFPDPRGTAQTRFVTVLRSLGTRYRLFH